MKSEIDLPPLDFRAAVGTIDETKRTVALIFSTGADVVRFDFGSGRKYIERLSLDPRHVRLERLNGGAPLLNSHSAFTLADQIGVVEPNSARVDGSTGTAVVRFSKRADVEPIFRDVLDRIVRAVSVGYRVHRFEETPGKANEIPIRVAVDWEPYEVSLVSMGADAGAQMRGTKDVRTNRCLVVAAGGSIYAGLSVADADRNRRLRLAQVRAGA